MADCRSLRVPGWTQKSICIKYTYFFFFTSSVYNLVLKISHSPPLIAYMANVPAESGGADGFWRTPFFPGHSAEEINPEWPRVFALGRIRSQTHSAAHCSGIQAVEEQDQQGRLQVRKPKKETKRQISSVWESTSEQLPPPPHSFPKTSLLPGEKVDCINWTGTQIHNP